MLTQIYNGHVLTPEGWVNGGSVIIEDCRIKEVSKSSRQLEGMDKLVDAQGMHVVPGGIDLHCHGGGGSDFQECTHEALRQLLKPTCATAQRPSMPHSPPHQST